SRGGGGGRLRTGRGKHHAREQVRFALDQGVRSLDQGRDRSLRLSVREALTGLGAGAKPNHASPEESAAFEDVIGDAGSGRSAERVSAILPLTSGADVPDGRASPGCGVQRVASG